MGKNDVRLFRQFQPSSYTLKIEPNRTALTFTGSVTIKGKKTGRPSQRITLHGKDLKVISATLVKHDKKGDQPFTVDRINLQKSFNEIRLHSKTLLYPGEYTINLEFTGIITRGMTGLYPCFFEVDGVEHSLLMTQLESHHAREVFPCIDEPEAKATFDLTVTSEAGLSVLGNTAIKTQTTKGALTTTNFETTPRMSSYLLAFIIGELHGVSTKTKRGTDVSVWATIAQPANSLNFALDIAKKSIEFFEEYFGVDYPLAKADHVAVPDFSNGAMENWGLITYRERALLAYPGDISQSNQEFIATVITHETSHQWFGNLVTMKWWDDLWLNESFADMMEYEAVNAMHPEWHIWDTFIAQDGLSALRRDSTPGVQSVKIAVHHPDEISTIFDPSIVYAKGGRLLYMLKNYVGESAFRRGLSAYFTKHAYGNTTGADLWAALSESSGKDIAAFMNPWLEQSGFPVVSITQTGKVVTMEQEHFLDNPTKADKTRLWPVPLFADGLVAADILSAQKQNFTATSMKRALIDNGALGHYIVRYVSDTQKKAVVDMIAEKQLGAADRLMLLNGGSMLSRAGYEPYSNILTMLGAYDNEDSEPVWDMIALIVSEVRRFIDLDETLEDKIKQLVRKIIAKQYERLGWEEKDGEPASDQKLRATIIGLGAYAEVPAIVTKALGLFKAYQTKPESVLPELRSIVFAVPIRLQTPGALEYLLKLHDKTSNSDLKADICAGATTTRSAEVAKQLLARLKDAKLIKPQDADRWLIQLIRNHYVKQTGWDWMVDNWDWLEKTYKHDNSYDMLPRYAATTCNTKEWADKYEAFFTPKTDQIVLKRNIAMGLEEIAARVDWLARDLKAVQAFFKA